MVRAVWSGSSLFVMQLVFEMSEHLLLVERQRFRNVCLNFRALNSSNYA